MSRTIDKIVKVFYQGEWWTGTGREVLFTNLWWYECTNEAGTVGLIRP